MFSNCGLGAAFVSGTDKYGEEGAGIMEGAAGARLNRLAQEKSPYLLQHSTNPVDWYPWGEEALRKARNDGKPIMLSIGYSSCHWCHRLRKESFEDAKTAAFINRNFIPIKVDREERPDLDAYYMAAVQAMTGGGGWPLTVFLTPDLRPFYGGTYYPPEPRYGMPGFPQVLEFVAKVWKERREEALGTAAQVAEALKAEAEGPGPGELSKDLLEGAYAAMVSAFDPAHGGFGQAPKFPLPLSLMFLLRYHFRTGKEMALTACTKTLDAMAAGGIRDHVGGGFHRYSTDRHWLVPHFEKMLYDNALLARVYTAAFQVTRKEEYKRVAYETLGWLGKEMQAPEGGFYSAQDADSEDGEGFYYTWTPGEVEEVLGVDPGREFCAAYGVTNSGNFGGGRSILHLGSAGVDSESRTPEVLARLYEARTKRARPGTDTKLVTSWNGLAISAFAAAGAAFQRQEYADSAARAAGFILEKCQKDGKLKRRYAGGEAGIQGSLEDYAFLIQGLLDLFESTSDPNWLEEASRLAATMKADFEDGDKGGFFASRDQLLAGMKESHDGPIPSGNSSAATALVKLAELTGDDSFRRTAELTARCFGRALSEEPSGHAMMMEAVDSLLNGGREVVVVAPTRRETRPMAAEVFSLFAPDVSILTADRTTYSRLARTTSLLEGRAPGETAVAYMCTGFACKAPARSPEELRAQLSGG